MPGDRRAAHTVVGTGATVAFAGLVIVLAVATGVAGQAGVGVEAGLPLGGPAIAWLLLRGGRPAGLEVVVLVLLTYAAHVLTGSGPGLAGALTVAAAVQTAAAVVLLRRWSPDLWVCGGDRPLEGPRALGWFAVTLAVSTALGAVPATVGSALLAEEPLGVAGLIWFGRHLWSALIVVALVLLLGQRVTATAPPRLLGAAGWPEAVAASVFTAGAYVLVFRSDELPLTFALLAATVWVGLRFSTLLSCVHSLVAGLVTIALTAWGVGPFAAVDRPDVGYLLAEAYLATIVICGFAISTGREEREALLEELRRSHEEVEYQAGVREAAIGSIKDALFVLDETGEVLLHNASAAALFGVAEDSLASGEITARSVRRWADGSPMAESERPSRKALAGEPVLDAEVLLTVDGQPDRVVAVTAVPLPREARGPARALLVFRDATTEHARREELAAFAGVVAHDLRNPVAAIDGWTEMLADELDAGTLDLAATRDFVSRVRSSSRRMRELIRDLLAHATSSARDLEMTRVEVCPLATEIAAARHAAHQVCCEAVPPVMGDPVLIRQVLDNLIGNALKYVAPGVEPRVTVGGCSERPGFVTVRVADNGIGVPAGEEEQIFEEFHRAHHRDYEGSGLGLSIVRRIIARHDGTIRARPNPSGQGTVFEFTLPAYDA